MSVNVKCVKCGERYVKLGRAKGPLVKRVCPKCVGNSTGRVTDS